MSEPTTSPGFKVGAPQFAGVFILLVVFGTYVRAMSTARWPGGHPYSGLSLALLGFILLASQPQMSSNQARAMMVGALIASLGGLLWFVSAVQQMG